MNDKITIKAARTLDEDLLAVKRMYRFIEAHIEEEDSSFNIEGFNGDGEIAVMLVCDSGGAREITSTDEMEGKIDTPHQMVITRFKVGNGQNAGEKLTELIHEWYACLKWLSKLTACILTEEDPEFTGEVKVTLRFKREDAQHGIDIVRDALGDYLYAMDKEVSE